MVESVGGLERNRDNIRVCGVGHSKNDMALTINWIATIRKCNTFVQIWSNHCGADSFETWSIHDHHDWVHKNHHNWKRPEFPQFSNDRCLKLCIKSRGSSWWECIIYLLKMEQFPEERMQSYRSFDAIEYTFALLEFSKQSLPFWKRICCKSNMEWKILSCNRGHEMTVQMVNTWPGHSKW